MIKPVMVALTLFCALWVMPSWAQEHPFNLHIGGGFGIPLDPTANYAGLSGTFQVGGGPNEGKHSSIMGEFMWHGLPPTHNALLPIANAICINNGVNTPICSAASLNASDNLYAVTAEYKYHREGERYGYYFIGGGGWYYRYAQLKNVTVSPGTVCQPAWDWWGYVCQSGFISTNNVLATKGVSSGGVNIGPGMTIALGGSGLRFYLEARYHYSPQGGHIATQIIPVTLGFSW